MAPKGKKTKSPPILSHEWIIQNHADIVAVFTMVFMVGLMVEKLTPLASSFIMMQHNTTVGEEANAVLLYRSGVKDCCAVFFYTLVMILVHAVLQEFVLDKFNKKLHLSKVKFSKFNESGQLFVFYAFAFLHAVNILSDNYVAEDYVKALSGLWIGYPEDHVLMPFSMKLFYVLQLSYWIHIFPELYFQKVKRSEMQEKIVYASLYLVCISFGYIMGFQRVMLLLLCLHYLVEGLFHLARLLYLQDFNHVADGGFKLWSILFVCIRLASVMLSVLTFWFGFAQVNETNPSLGTSFTSRVSALASVCLLQAWMSWNFITFHMKRNRDTKTPAKSVTKSINGASRKKVQ